LVELQYDDLQVREEHWVVADLIGKGKHIRTVPMPSWVKRAVDDWMQAAGITAGFIFRAVSRTDAIWKEHITPKAIWHVVKGAARRAGIAKLAPHDLRRYAESRTMPNRHVAATPVKRWTVRDSA
jgi:site-specific recombinase XerD